MFVILSRSPCNRRAPLYTLAVFRTRKSALKWVGRRLLKGVKDKVKVMRLVEASIHTVRGEL